MTEHTTKAEPAQLALNLDPAEPTNTTSPPAGNPFTGMTDARGRTIGTNDPWTLNHPPIHAGKD